VITTSSRPFVRQLQTGCLPRSSNLPQRPVEPRWLAARPGRGHTVPVSTRCLAVAGRRPPGPTGRSTSPSSPALLPVPPRPRESATSAASSGQNLDAITRSSCRKNAKYRHGHILLWKQSYEELYQRKQVARISQVHQTSELEVNTTQKQRNMKSKQINKSIKFWWLKTLWVREVFQNMCHCRKKRLYRADLSLFLM